VQQLLERAGELEAIRRCVERCRAGDGELFVVEGAAGIGKTALVGATRTRAHKMGLRICAAHGSELEREFAFGVTRQLLEPAVASSDDGDLFAGAARLAVPVLAADADAQAAGTGDPLVAVLHGLYWLTANLAARGPLVLVVDDAHWCDDASLRFLLHLAHRIEALPVLVVVAARRGEPGGPDALLDRVAAEANTVLSPATLSVGAVGELVRGRLGEPDDRFVLACHDSTGGNPFLATELVAALERDGVAPSANSVSQLSEVRPDTIARAIVLRLARQPEAAGALAEAAAVLADRSELRHAAALAGLNQDEAAVGFDSLARIGVLRPRLPLEFVHPIVRAAIYGDIGPAARSLAHARAAHLLANEMAEPERVALQLLRSEPVGEEWAVDVLSTAATGQLARGAPDAAARLLERALAEPPSEERHAGLLAELGWCEDLMGRPSQAVEHLRTGLSRATTTDQRVKTAIRLCLVLLRRGRVSEATDLIRAELQRLGEGGPHAVTLETHLCLGLQFEGAEGWREVNERLERLAPRLDSRSPDGRTALAQLAYRRSIAGVTADRALEPALAALEAGLVEDRGAESGPAANAIGTLVQCEAFDAARLWTARALERSQSLGSVFGFAISSQLEALLSYRLGELMRAIASAEASIHASDEYGADWLSSLALAVLIDASTDRGDFETVEHELQSRDLAGPVPPDPLSGLLLESRGRYRVSRGELDAGLRDLREAGARLSGWGALSPGFTAWRSACALACHHLGLDENAVRLAREELELARVLGTPRATAAALRTLGVVEGAGRGIELLQQAVITAERSPALLERATALIALGAALRRAGRRVSAREPLRGGLDLARRCGAERLAGEGEAELRAAGAKPRRRAFSGLDALTASERRIAEMVAAGMSNREVAQALFVTAKTVENHLGRVYQKLGIHSRSELAAALGSIES
jgi:DNA-binding CsgD family transcriptional regulator